MQSGNPEAATSIHSAIHEQTVRPHRQRISKTVHAGLFLLLCLPASAAFAVATSTATLDNFTITLYSLKPGNTPGINWNTQSSQADSGTSVSVWGYPGGNYTVNSQGNNGNTPFGPVSSSVSFSTGSASASITNTGHLYQPTGLSLSATAIVGGLPDSSVDYTAGAGAPWLSTTGFTLTPDTIAVFTATANVSASTYLGHGSVSGFTGDFAQATAGLAVNGGNNASSDALSINANASSIWNPATNTWSYPGQSVNSGPSSLKVRFVNTSSQNMDGEFSASVYVNGSSSIPLVPEPTSLALMAPGMLFVGLAARRQTPRQRR